MYSLDPHIVVRLTIIKAKTRPGMCLRLIITVQIFYEINRIFMRIIGRIMGEKNLSGPTPYNR